MLRRVKKSFLFLSSAHVCRIRSSVLHAFLLLSAVVILQPRIAFCNEHAVHSEKVEHASHKEHKAHNENIVHSEHEEHAAHDESAMHGSEHGEHGEKAVHSEHEEGSHGSIAMNIVHWCFLFFLMSLAVKSLLSKLVFKDEDATMKSYGALVFMVIFFYAYEQMPGIAHYHDTAFWGFIKFIVKMFTGICLTAIGILGMHEHHEGDEHGHDVAHH